MVSHWWVFSFWMNQTDCDIISSPKIDELKAQPNVQSVKTEQQISVQWIAFVIIIIIIVSLHLRMDAKQEK